MTSIINVKELKTYFYTLDGVVKAVDNISFQLDRGDFMGLVGESGCGKSTTALSILRLIPKPGRIASGEILFEGKNLLKMDAIAFRKQIRWKKISTVFQGAMNSLNPVFRVRDQIVEAIQAHENVEEKTALDRVEKLLEMVGIECSRGKSYPHEFSGGMKQRAIIAMALACNPDLIIADEPTTALDVIVQAQILGLIKKLRSELNLSMILITHDISIMSQMCNKVGIMYAGKLLEFGETVTVIKKPLNPYTKGLIEAFPDIMTERKIFSYIPGTPPALGDVVMGCRFAPRCSIKKKECEKIDPEMKDVGGGHFVACHLL